MDLFCVNCGALITSQVAACTGCGTSRDASLPPGNRAAGAPTTILRAPLIPVQRQPTELPPLPVYSAQQVQPVAARTADREPVGGASVGVADVAITLIAAVVAFGLGWLVHGDVESIRSWMVLRSVFGIDPATELSGHDVLVMLVTFSPLALAVLVASISRVRGTGLLVACAAFAALMIDGNGPRMIALAPEFELNRDWVVVVVLAGFAVADLIVAFADRGPMAGLLAGALTGVLTAGAVTLYVDRLNSLAIFEEAWLVVVILVVPTLALLVAGLVGGAIGGLRRR